MSGAEAVLIIAVIVLVVALVGWRAVRKSRRRAELQGQFGPEYERTIEETGSRRTAERELSDRARRHEKYTLRPLSNESRERYAHAWNLAQARFVDDPHGAVSEADQLVSEAMAERGYPTDDFDQQAADLSVEHADTVERYRAGHEIGARAGNASTEELRQAMQHYRTIFDSVLAIDLRESARDAEALVEEREHSLRNRHER
jgi:hypothetical protein